MKAMIINGIPIKKYRARVKARNMETSLNEPISEDGYKVVEGYISIAVVNLPYGTAEPQYIPIFVSEEINFNQIIFSGMGSTLIHPVTYTEGEYELLGDVD